MTTDGWVNLKISKWHESDSHSIPTNLRISPDQPSVTSLGNEATEGCPALKFASLVQGVVTQPASLGTSLQVRVAISGHDVPGLQELGWPVLLVTGKPESISILIYCCPVVILPVHNVRQSFVGLLSTAHGFRMIDVTVLVFKRPFLKGCVKTWASNGTLTFFSAAIKFKEILSHYLFIYLVVKSQNAETSQGKAKMLLQPVLCLSCLSFLSEKKIEKNIKERMIIYH